MEISLQRMTKELCRRFYQGFVMDRALFLDQNEFRPFVYDQAERDAYFERYQHLGRVHLAVMLGDQPIGEVVLKNFEEDHCTLGITMQSDEFKNKGYGTEAERLAVAKAFGEMKMKTVYADAVKTNQRSRHVLEKVGFKFLREDKTFAYYRCTEADFVKPGE